MTTTIPIEALKGLVKRGNKYHAVKTTIDGITFDSKKEARRWDLLKLAEQVGEITRLRRQVRYSLDVSGVHICDYVSDFEYCCKDGLVGNCIRWTKVVEDVKSEATRKLPLYRLKKALMLACYQITIRES